MTNVRITFDMILSSEFLPFSGPRLEAEHEITYLCQQYCIV